MDEIPIRAEEVVPLDSVATGVVGLRIVTLAFIRPLRVSGLRRQ